MLEISIDNAHHTDPFAELRHAWPQATHAPHVETNGNARLRSGIQSVDDLRIDERIDLGIDKCLLSLLPPVRLSLDQLDQPLPQARRGRLDFAVTLRLRIACDGIEEGDRVRAELFVRCEQAGIAINASRDFVVVSRAEVNVADDA